MSGVAILAAAAAPSVRVALIAPTIVAATSVTFLTVGNSTLQLAAEFRFRGCVMALWAVAFLGRAPLGAPVVGAISGHLSPRGGLPVGGLASLAAAALGAFAIARDRHRSPHSLP